MKMSHAERQKRRKYAASCIERGENPHEVCQRLEVCYGWLEKACREFGVPMHVRAPEKTPAELAQEVCRPSNNYQTTLTIVAKRLGGMAPVEIFKEMNVRKQYIYWVLKRAEECGIVFPE